MSGAESQRALELLDERFPEFAGDPLALVFRSETTVDDPAVRQQMEALFAEVAALDGVREVVSPYTGFAPVNADRTTAIAQIRLLEFGPEADPALVRTIIERTEELSERPGLQVDVGGPTAMFAEMEPPGEREAAGVLVALVVLVVTFGSLLAAGLPVAVALGGLGAGMAGVLLLTRAVEVFTFAPPMAAMIGLGVGIDYALFILTRYRHELGAGVTPEDAAATAIGTAGRAVVFAGATVVVSLLGMVLMGVSMVVGMALSAALVVLCTVLAAVTLLPAVLGFIGPAIDRYTVRGLRRGDADPAQSRWHRWSRAIQARPWPPLLVALVALVGLALPVLDLDLGGPHFGAGPTSQSSRRAYDSITEGFGEGFNGPLILVAELTPGEPSQRQALDAVVARVARTDGVALATPPLTNPAGDTAVITVVPRSAPNAPETEALVESLREDVIPTAAGAVPVSVSGVTALFADMSELLGRRLPVFIAAVIGVSFLLLMAVFRSVLVPLKAAIMNLLSIGAAYGVVVAVFQWGWGASLIGVDRPGPIMAFVPMMLFAILFGLSMDYEVFLLSRIREEYDRTGNNATAVADGLATTARVITAAAAIMVVIFSSFVLGDDPVVKMFGLGLAVAVLVDATVVRMVVVPATMELLGDANWWLPAWIDRRLPRLQLEEAGTTGRPGAGADSHLASPQAAPRPAQLTESTLHWLESLHHDDRGQALAHLEHALGNGALASVHRDGLAEVIVPLGRRTRRLDVTGDGATLVVDVKTGKASAERADWDEVHAELLEDRRTGAAYDRARRAVRLAHELRCARERAGMTPDEVAAAAGTSVDVVRKLERGDGSVPVLDLVRISAVLDLRIDLTSVGAVHGQPASEQPASRRGVSALH
ncbi:MAG: MMPL family transporter [Actinomycetota bacterium]|nr:MMPL family transporter [Actinomycetota bacterium]